jgi:DNA-binding LacI/PurR family transcriptional regulator
VLKVDRDGVRGGLARLVRAGTGSSGTGYRQALAEAYDEKLVVHGDYTYASGMDGMNQLLAVDPGLDAVFVSSDLMAAGALSVLRTSGYAVPDDVAVVGFDDSSYATSAEPPLTTIRQPWDRISEEMVRLLLDLIGGRQPVSVTVPTELVVRDSA